MREARGRVSVDPPLAKNRFVSAPRLARALRTLDRNRGSLALGFCVSLEDFANFMRRPQIPQVYRAGPFINRSILPEASGRSCLFCYTRICIEISYLGLGYPG